MDVKSLYSQTEYPVVSIEFAPPPTGKPPKAISNTMEVAKDYKIAFADITWGALKSTRAGTMGYCTRFQEKYGVPFIPHLPASRKSTQDVENILVDMDILGITGVYPIQGDDTTFHESGPRVASDMVEQITRLNAGKYLPQKEGNLHTPGQPTHFSIGVTAYPQGFCGDLKKDSAVLRLKQDVGADYAITQAYFEPDTFADWLAEEEAKGITIPIVAAIPTMGNYRSFQIFNSIPGVEFPKTFIENMTRVGDELTEVNKALKDLKGDESKAKECEAVKAKADALKEEIKTIGHDYMAGVARGYLKNHNRVHVFTMGDKIATGRLLEAIAEEYPAFRK